MKNFEKALRTDGAEKTKFRLWLENFWYHYQWQTIFGVFFALVIIVSTIQLVGNRGYKTNIVIAADVGFTPTQETIIQHEITGALCEGNDEIAINTVNMSADFAYQSQETFYSGVGITTYVYILSERVFLELDKAGRFVPIAEFTGEGEFEYCNENGVYLKSTDFGSLSSLASLPDDSVICFAAKALIAKDKDYDASKELLADIFAYTADN